MDVHGRSWRQPRGPRGNNLHRFEIFYQNATTSIWPRLSYMCDIRSTVGLIIFLYKGDCFIFLPNSSSCSSTRAARRWARRRRRQFCGTTRQLLGTKRRLCYLITTVLFSRHSRAVVLKKNTKGGRRFHSSFATMDEEEVGAASWPAIERMRHT